MGCFFYNMLTVVSVIIILIVVYYIRAFRYWKTKGVPYPKPSFPFGNFSYSMTKHFGRDLATIYKEMKGRGAEYCGYYILAKPIFMPLTVDLCKFVLVKEFQSFQDRGFASDEENDPMGASILTLGGHKWRSLRNKLTPAFSAGNMKLMFPTIVACSQEIEKLVDDFAKNSEPIDVEEICGRYATDVIGSCAFGIKCNCLQNPNAEFRNYGRMIFAGNFSNNIRLAIGVAAPSIAKLIKMHAFNPDVTSFFYNIVKETVEYREKNNIHCNDFMDLLIKLKNNGSIRDNTLHTDNYKTKNNDECLTLEQIAAQAFLFFAAGFETSSCALTFLLYELALHPEIQDKVRDEVKLVLIKYNGEMTYEAANEMRYTERVIQESMRIYPPVQLINRVCTQKVEIPGSGVFIDEGTSVAISTLGIHMDPEYYPNPDKFDPDRFTEEAKSMRPPYTYMPFGDGPRMCPGTRFGILEIKVAVAVFLKNHRYTLIPGTKVPMPTYTNGVVVTSEETIYFISEKL